RRSHRVSCPDGGLWQRQQEGEATVHRFGQKQYRASGSSGRYSRPREISLVLIQQADSSPFARAYNKPGNSSGKHSSDDSPESASLGNKWSTKNVRDKLVWL